MGNCNACVRSVDSEHHRKKQNENPQKKKYRERRPNPYASDDLVRSPVPIRVLKDVTPLSHQTRIGDKYVLGGELGRGEFGITYLCMDREMKEALGCKSISKKKLRTAVDIEDVRREVSIMSRLPDHPNVVRLQASYEDFPIILISPSQ